MSGIFISYRREDARGDAGRLADDLKQRLGNNLIFRDIDAIEPGMDFVKAINKAVSSCDVLLAIIGPLWLTAQDKMAKRRLDDGNDYVRLEIVAALNRDIRVIPILVGDAVMPAEQDLPGQLKGLARRQAYDLSDKRWDYDVEQLITVIEKIPGINVQSALFGDKTTFKDNFLPGSFGSALNFSRIFGNAAAHVARNSLVDGQSIPKPGMTATKKIAWSVAILIILGMIGQCSETNILPYNPYPSYSPY